MRGVSELLVLVLALGWGAGQFLNNRPHPTYSLESMPDTDFTCRDKILGGYYADAQTQCQMFHICVKVAGIGVQDFRFLCPNGTAFDQDHQICAEWDDVDCDATTLYYASDNFDLYRLGSGTSDAESNVHRFESKAVKYGEEEETFSLQRAETGDARLNREHQAARINQQREFNNQAAPSYRKQQQNNNNNERDIFKTSSSSNFFNNRNGGKEVDDDEDDDNVNANQNRDNFQKKKLVRKQQRRPEQQLPSTQQPQQQQVRQQQPQRVQQQPQPQQRPPQPQQQPPQQQQRVQQPQQQQHQQFRPQQPQQNQRPIQQQPQQQNQRPIQPPPQQQPQPQNRPQHIRQPNPTTIQQQPINTQTTQNFETQTQRNTRPTGFINNFAGSFPTTSARPASNPPATSSTANLNPDQYSTAINNFRQRNSQRRPVNRQYNDADNFRQTTPLAAVSTPAPFRQTQHHNKPTTYNNGQYNPTTYSPKTTQSQTENYPPGFNKQQATQAKPTPFKNPQTSTTSGFDTHYDVPKIKVKQVNKENYPTTLITGKPIKKDQFLPTTFAPKTQFVNINNNNNNNKQTTPFYNAQQFNNQFQGQNQQNQQIQKVKQQQPQQPQPFSNNNNNRGQFNNNNNNNQFNNNNNNQFNTPPQTTQFSQPPSTPQAFNPTNHFSRPFANQFSQTLNQNLEGTETNHKTETSTIKTTPFTQYTPTVPKLSSTTPVTHRANRFDETQYDDGSYNPKYDQYDDNNNNGNKEDEFLKTAHSQNIASSRNELAKNAAKKATTFATTQKPFYSESPRPFSTNNNFGQNTKVTENYPKTTKLVATPRPQQQQNFNNQQQQQRPQQQQQQQRPQQQPQQQQFQQRPQQQQQQQQQVQKQIPQQQQQPQQQPQQQAQQPKAPAGSNEKNASYDYAYYDSNVGPEPEYDIDTDFKKTTTS